MGRKPTPTAIRKLRGNPGKRPINEREPAPARGIPSCPRWLKGEARHEWLRVTKLLDDAGVLTLVDRAAVLAYCQAWGRWVEAEKALQEEPGPIITNPSGRLVVHPLVTVAAQAWAQTLKAAAELGITPSSRSRVSAVGDTAPTLAELLFAEVAKGE